MTTPDITCPKRLQDAVEAAELAFFTTLAQAYPEIKTGDIDPYSAQRFTDACHDVAKVWIDGNQSAS